MAAEKQRISITVKTKGTERTSNDSPVVNFSGADGISYSVWGKELVACIAIGAVLDAEVTTQTKDDKTYHNVVQIYDADGKGIRPQQQRQSRSGGGGQVRGPEDRVSAESTAAATITKDLLIAGKLLDTDELVTKLKSWLKPRLSQAVPQVAPPAPAEPVINKPSTSNNKPAQVVKSDTINQDLWAEIQAAVKEKGYTKTEFNALVRSFNVLKISELSFTQGKELLAKIKTGAGLGTPPAKEEEKSEDIPF